MSYVGYVVLNWGMRSSSSDALLLCDEESRVLIFSTHRQAEKFVEKNIDGNTLIIEADNYQPAVEGAYANN